MSNLVVLIGGGHAAGKATTARCIKQDLQNLPHYDPKSLQIDLVDMNTYMDSSTVTKSDLAKNSAITVGHKPQLSLKPSRFDFAAIKNYIASHSDGTRTLFIVHGLYALYDKELCDMAQVKVYVDSDADTRLIRWIRKDVLGENPESTLQSVINSYLQGARQEMTDYIFQTKERADVIMPRGYEQNGVSLISDGLLHYLGSENLQRVQHNTLRPLQGERFNNQKGKYYELT